MKRFVVAVLFAAASLSAQTVVVRDTIKNADATKASCSVKVSWAQFTTSTGIAVAKGSRSLNVNGDLQLSLYPTVGATPTGTSYTADYTCGTTTYREYWTIPATGPVNLSQIRTSPAPTIVTTFAEHQLTLGSGLRDLLGLWRQNSAPPATAEGQCYWDGLAHTLKCSDATLAFQEISGNQNHALLGPKHTDTTAASPTLGAIIVGQGSGTVTWRALARCTSGQYIGSDGTDTLCRQIAYTQLSGLPPLGTSAALDVGSTAGTVAAGDDARLSDDRTPIAHAATHQTGGGDQITELTLGSAYASLSAASRAYLERWTTYANNAGTTFTINPPSNPNSGGLMAVMETNGTATDFQPAAIYGVTFANPSTSAVATTYRGGDFDIIATGTAPMGILTGVFSYGENLTAQTAEELSGFAVPWLTSAAGMSKKIYGVHIGGSDAALTESAGLKIDDQLDFSIKTDAGKVQFGTLSGSGSRFVRASAVGLLSAAALSGADLPNPGASSLGGVQSKTCSSTDKLSAIGTDGVPVCSADAGGSEVTAYAADKGSATSWTIAGATIGLGTCDLVFTIYEADGTKIKDLKPETYECETAAGANQYDVTVTWATAQAGRIVLVKKGGTSGGGGGGGTWGSIVGSLVDQGDLSSALAGKAASSHAHAPGDVTGTAVITTDSRLSDARTPTSHTHPESDVTSLTTDLAAKEATANRNATNGYAGLSSGLLAASQLPLPAPTTLGAIKSLTCTGTDKLSAIGTDGLPVCSADSGGGSVAWADITGKPTFVTDPGTTLGQTLYFNGSTWAALSGNTTTTRKFLSQTGTGSVSAATAWNQIALADLSDGTTGTGAAVARNTPTLDTPIIASLTNAQHAHQSSAGGGALDAAAISTGVFNSGRLPSNSYATSKTSATTWTVTGATHALATCDLQISLTQTVSGSRERLEADKVACNASTFDITVTWAIAQAGNIALIKGW